MTTPENKVKEKVRTVLERYQHVFTYWPVPMGYGRRTVDVFGCYRGRFFVIETKAPGKKPTLLQDIELRHVGEAMGKTFVIAGTDDPELDRLTTWLNYLTETVPYDPDIPKASVNRRGISA